MRGCESCDTRSLQSERKASDCTPREPADKLNVTENRVVNAPHHKRHHLGRAMRRSCKREETSHRYRCPPRAAQLGNSRAFVNFIMRTRGMICLRSPVAVRPKIPLGLARSIPILRHRHASSFFHCRATRPGLQHGKPRHRRPEGTRSRSRTTHRPVDPVVVGATIHEHPQHQFVYVKEGER